MSIFDPTPAAPAPDEIVTYLERLLAEARAGRVLFLVASAGVVGPDARKPPLAGLDVRELLAETTPMPADPPRGSLPIHPPIGRAARAADTQAPTRTYGVEVGAFVGAFAEGLGPRELVSACKDAVSGVDYAKAAVLETVAQRAGTAGTAGTTRSGA